MIVYRFQFVARVIEWDDNNIGWVWLCQLPLSYCYSGVITIVVMTVVLLRGIINYCGGSTGGAFDESNGESGDI